MAQKSELTMTELVQPITSSSFKDFPTQNTNQAVQQELSRADSKFKCKGKSETIEPEGSLIGELAFINKTAEDNTKLVDNSITCQQEHPPNDESSVGLLPHTDVALVSESDQVSPNTSEASDSSNENLKAWVFSEPSLCLCNTPGQFNNLQEGAPETEITVMIEPIIETPGIANDKSSSVTVKEDTPHKPIVEIAGDMAETNEKSAQAHETNVMIMPSINKQYLFSAETNSSQNIQELHDSIPQPGEEGLAEKVPLCGSQESMMKAELSVISPEVHLKPQCNILQNIAEKTVEILESDSITNSVMTTSNAGMVKTEAYVGTIETSLQPIGGSCSSIMEQIVLSSITCKEADGFPFVESDNEIETGEDDVLCDNSESSQSDITKGEAQCLVQNPKGSGDTCTDASCSNSCTLGQTDIDDAYKSIADEKNPEVVPCEEPPVSKRPRLLGQSEDSDNQEEFGPDDGSATLLQGLPVESAKLWPVLPLPPCRQEHLGGNNSDDNDEDGRSSDLTTTPGQSVVVGNDQSLVEACDQLVPEDVCPFSNSSSSLYSNILSEKPRHWNEVVSAKISTSISLTDQVIPHFNAGNNNISCFRDIDGKDYLLKRREPIYPTKKQRLRLGLSKKQKIQPLHGNSV